MQRTTWRTQVLILDGLSTCIEPDHQAPAACSVTALLDPSTSRDPQQWVQTVCPQRTLLVTSSPRSTFTAPVRCELVTRHPESGHPCLLISQHPQRQKMPVWARLQQARKRPTGNTHHGKRTRRVVLVANIGKSAAHLSETSQGGRAIRLRVATTMPSNSSQRADTSSRSSFQRNSRPRGPDNDVPAETHHTQRFHQHRNIIRARSIHDLLQIGDDQRIIRL